MNISKIKNCQSCGMSLIKDPKAGGTEKDGTKSKKYCSLCYVNGEFKGGNISLKEFSVLTKNEMIKSGNNRFFAWLFSRPFMLKNLERWNKTR